MLVLVGGLVGGLVSAPATAGSSDYRLARAKTPDGVNRVVRWNPCQKVTYRVNVSLAAGTSAGRSSALADVRRAVSRLSARTGIPFAYEGRTSQVPTSTSSRTWWQRQQQAELVVAWVDQRRAATRSSLLGKTAGRWSAGTGGQVYKAWTSSGKWRLASGRGFVVLDAAQRRSFKPGFGAGVTRGALLMHELAHVMGLEHVSATSQLMYPVIRNRSSTSYRSGDRTGLAKVGRPAGCIRVPAAVWPAI